MQSPAVPEPAVAVGEDPRSYARLMSAVYDATMSGGRAPARPRDVIGESWQRMLARGVNPDTHIPPVIEASGLDALRKSSGLLAVLDDVSRGLESIVAEGDNILVLADARAGCCGGPGPRPCWARPTGSGSSRVPTGVRVPSAPTPSGPRWRPTGPCRSSPPSISAQPPRLTCAGALVRDPRTGQVIGVVDVSGQPRRCTHHRRARRHRSPGWPKRTCASSMRGR